MKVFMLKSFIVASLMFISVLAGMQIARDGMNKMRGQQGQDKVIVSDMNDDGDKGIAVIPSHDLKKKKQKMQEINGVNVFSELGKKMADGVSKTSQSIVESITNK